MENGLEQQVLAKAQKWLDGNYDAETKKQVKYLMDNDMKELVESFYKDLELVRAVFAGSWEWAPIV